MASGTLFADAMVFNRGLPTENLNNAAGANRSNTSWGFAGNENFTGDDFTIAGTGNYTISDLRIWTDDGANAAFDFTTNYTSLSLYGGVANNGVTALQSGTFTGGTSLSNPNIIITPVTYADASTYQGSSTYYQLWQVDFTNLNWVVSAGQLMQFGVLGVTVDPNYAWVNHASNAALSGSPQDGADNKFLGFDSLNLNAPPTAFDSSDPDLAIWDKSSDINVQVFAAAAPVPEPGAITLFGSLLGILALTRVRKLSRRSLDS